MNPLLLELIRQGLRWLGVWLMTIGVPEGLANLVAHEDAVVALGGFLIYAASDTGWAVSFYRRVKSFGRR